MLQAELMVGSCSWSPYNPPSSTPYNGQFYTYDYVGTFLKSIGVTKLGGFAYGIPPSATNAIKGTMTAGGTKGIADRYGNYSVPFGTVDFTADALALKSKGLRRSGNRLRRFI
jgi:hypothetical protein